MPRLVDPDVGTPGPVLGVIALGGALGALLRLGLSTALPHAGGFAWSTLLANATGSVVLGALVVVLTERVRAHRLARPFLGTGVLGGFTTFSTYAVESVTRDAPVTGALYAVTTVVLAVGGAGLGVRLARS